MQEQSLHHISRDSGRDFSGWTNPFLGQYLYPSPVQSSRSIQRMQTVLVPKQNEYDEFLVTKRKELRYSSSLCITYQETQEEILVGGPTLLMASTYTHLLYKAQDLFSECRQSCFLNKMNMQNFQSQKRKQFRCRNSLCITDQETQEEILLGGPTLLMASTYTHLLYKAQDLFSECRQSSNKNGNNLDIAAVFASQINKLRKRFQWVVQPFSRSVLTPISCTQLKIYSVNADSPAS